MIHDPIYLDCSIVIHQVGAGVSIEYTYEDSEEGPRERGADLEKQDAIRLVAMLRDLYEIP